MRAHCETAVRITTLLTLAASVVACDQPAPKCGIARGAFSARYTFVPGTKVGEGDCDTLVGDVIGVQAYSQKKKDSVYPDPNNVQIGLQPQALTDAIGRAQTCGMDNAAGVLPYSVGAFVKSDPGKDDFCTVPTLSIGRVSVPAQDSCQPDMCYPAIPPEPAAEYTYEWSNVRVYVTPGADGTQFAADLKYTKDGCTAQYKVSAVYPVVSCLAYQSANPATGDDAGSNDAGPTADGGLVGMDSAVDNDAGVDNDATVPEDDAGEFVKPDGCEPDAPDPGTPIADDSLCSQSAPLSPGSPTGSNINPDFVVQCDPNQFRCVLTNDPPSLR
jgi:hypothetical protein